MITRRALAVVAFSIANVKDAPRIERTLIEAGFQ